MIYANTALQLGSLVSVSGTASQHMQLQQIQ